MQDGKAVTAHLGWMRSRRIAAGTLKQRAGTLRRAQAELPNGLLAATVTDLVAWQETVSTRRHTPRSLGVELSHARGFFRWAVLYEHLDHDPTVRGLTLPRLPRLLPRPVGEGDVRMAIEAAEGPVRAMVALMAFAGLRCCEVSALNGQDVLRGEPAALRLHGKGDHERIVPCPSRLLAELDAARLPVRGACFLTRRGAQRMTPSRVSAVVAEHLRGLGINATGHQLRHRYGTRVYQASHDLLLTGSLLGHQSPTSTAGYAASDVSGVAAIAEAISV